MSKVKSSGTSSESAVQAEKDLRLVRQQAEMKAGEALLREVSQKIAGQREKAQSDAAGKEQEQSQPKDTAQLSELHSFSSAGKAEAMEELLRWALEMAGKNWEAFLAWQPVPGSSLAEQLEELSKLYLDLLEAAFKHTEEENLVLQMERLDSLLARKLNFIMEQNLEPLTELLEENGETAVADGIRSNLYRQTAGKALSPQAAHRLFVQEAPVRSGNSFHGLSLSFSGEGMIYQSSRKQNARFQQVYHGQNHSWKEQISQRNKVIHHARKGIAESSFRGTDAVSCSAKELERANRFAAHINGRGNLFQNPDISAENEEIKGLLAAVMTIKGQVYAAENGQTDSLVLSIQKAIEKFIDHHLGQKGVANVYYYTLSAYRKLRNPQKAIQTGQDFAYQRFHEKQKDPFYQKTAPYSKESGFFRALLKKISPEKDFALGTDILEKDWKNFLRALGMIKKSSYLSMAERYSPWGVLLEPERLFAESAGSIPKILLGIAVIILIIILAVLFFRAAA